MTHTRPFANGEPAKLWSLDCSCAEALKEDPLWAGTVSEIPETPDETHEREEREKRGQADHETQMREAFTQIAAATAADNEFKLAMLALMKSMQPASGQAQEAVEAVLQVADEPGGQLPSGLSVARNDTGSPERVDTTVLAKDEHRVRQSDAKDCPQCGKPLRKPGQRGATPKLCADCRGR